MKIAILHDLYLPIGAMGVSGEDNLVNLEITLLQERGHEIVDLRKYKSGLKRKLLQTSVHTLGIGQSPRLEKQSVDVIHSHNLNQLSGYNWLAETDIPVVQSLHNLRSFCPISIGWRQGQHCYDCLHSPISVIKNQCGGIYGIAGGLRHLVTQVSRPQISRPARLIASSQMMKDLFSQVYDAARIDVIPNPGISMSPPILDTFEERWLFAGRLVQEKGILEIIRNWPNSELLDIAGSGPLESQIREEISSRPNIRMIGTFHSQDSSIYARYRGLIFASTWMEGSPLVVADAISNGLPVVAFGTSAVKEQIANTGGGIFCDKRLTVESLESAFLQVRSAGISLRARCHLSGTTLLSTKTWIDSVENSLKEAAA
jgi:glycosyltransferase involved in cell wall biosynthesis